jgi:SAM-dependent methyltransferase
MSAYINPSVSGDKDVGWLEAIKRDYYPDAVGRALSLGCGGGALELQGIHWEIAKCFEGYDASSGAIELARKNAEEAKISQHLAYIVADLNKAKFEENRYDAVFASQSVHHIEALEHYMAQVVGALKKDGLFIVNEFVGPNQFQWSEPQLFHANRLLNLLPDELRIGIRGGKFIEAIDRPGIDHMNATDPTEAIRSADILSALDSNFELVEKRDFGGTLLHLILNNIAGNFTESTAHIELLEMLISEEKRLIEKKEIVSDFTLVIAKNSKQK